MSTHDLWLVIEPGRYYGSNKIVRVKRKKPRLQGNQVMVKIEVDIPQNIFDPPKAAIQVTDQNVIRPAPKASA